MSREFYKVVLEGVTQAETDQLEVALILLEALMEKYYNEPTLKISIEKFTKEEE